MNPIAIYGLLIAMAAVVNIPFLLTLLTKRTNPMPVIASFQPLLDELAANTAAAVALKTQLANTPAAQDLTDTQAALQAALDDQKTALGA
jgi:hypothetical protein